MILQRQRKADQKRRKPTSRTRMEEEREGKYGEFVDVNGLIHGFLTSHWSVGDVFFPSCGTLESNVGLSATLRVQFGRPDIYHNTVLLCVVSFDLGNIRQCRVLPPFFDGSRDRVGLKRER